MEILLHYFFLAALGTCSFFVLSSKNPVHSVLFLILVFLSSSGILIYIGAEFIALIFIIVYVGAIAVLFLFIVMMLDIKINKTNFLTQYIPFGLLVGFLFFMEIFIAVENIFSDQSLNIFNKQWLFLYDNITNIELLGQVLYQEFFISFLLCGILLLIAMLGAIVLTQKFSSLRTNEISSKQLSRGHSIFFMFFKD